MRKIFLAIAALAASHSFAIDTYLPIEQGSVVGQSAFEYLEGRGLYDEDGKLQELNGSASALMVGLGAKYGVMPNLETGFGAIFVSRTSVVEVTSRNPVTSTTTYSTQAVSESGLSQPTLWVKYGIDGNGIAPFAEITLPFGVEKIVGSDRNTRLAIGLVEVHDLDQIQMRSNLNYEMSIAGAGEPGLSIDLIPGLKVSETTIPELGISYYMGMGDDESNSLTLYPGAQFQVGPLAMGANIIYTVMGKWSMAAQGLQVTADMPF